MSESITRPSPFITQFEKMLGTRTHTILDVGCHLGRNSLFLARMGHNVVAVDNNKEDLAMAKWLAESRGIDTCQFVAAKAPDLPFRPGAFSAVIANEVMHMMPKAESQALLECARELTAKGGLNAISGYFHEDGGTPSDSPYFTAHELFESYDLAGWTVVDYREQTVSPSVIGEKLFINSLATIVAKRYQ